MLDRFLEFSDALRSAGVPVSTSEQTDAITAIRHVDPSHRGSFKAAVAAAMIKSESHRPQFDALFDLYFGTVPSEAPHHQPDDTGRDRNELVRDLVDALFAGDAVALGELAREAVARFGRLQNSPSGDWYSNYQVMRALDLDSIADLLEATLEEADLSPLEERLARDEFARRVAEFRAMALADTRRRVAAQRGPAAVARYAVNPVLEELPFLSATADLTEMRKAIRPLARKLAVRVAMKRRRSTRGTLDIRRTVRHAMS
ncbi:MAG TPA: hypothetical protein VFK89_03960, partial [Actinomycetota bacterium]|nr:hypothetical protein [Actinomycetota bacterium]